MASKGLYRDDRGYPAVCPDFYVTLFLRHIWAALN